MALRVFVCNVDDVVAGELRAFAVPGVTWPIMVTLVDGELIATAGVCPHEDVLLANGELDRGAVVCPGHGYRFDLRTGACAHDPDLTLRRYRITVVGKDLLVDLV